jgi:predicted lipoprotein with Yx(FWY)xxD motif
MPTKLQVAGYGVGITAIFVVAACGSSTATGSAGASTGPSATTTATGLTTHATAIGSVLADAQGRTVYELVGDPASNTTCATSCQSIWPPVMSDGAITVIHGHPLFTFVGDTAPGQTRGQNVNDTWGRWLALTAEGTPIAPAAATSPSATSGGTTKINPATPGTQPPTSVSAPPAAAKAPRSPAKANPASPATRSPASVPASPVATKAPSGGGAAF